MARNFQSFLLSEIESFTKTYLKNQYSYAILDDDAEVELEELVNDASSDIEEVLRNYSSKIDNVIEEQNALHFKKKDYVEGELYYE